MAGVATGAAARIGWGTERPVIEQGASDAVGLLPMLTGAAAADLGFV